MTMGSGIPWAESGDTNSSDDGSLSYQYQALGDPDEVCQLSVGAEFEDCYYPELLTLIEGAGVTSSDGHLLHNLEDCAPLGAMNLNENEANPDGTPPEPSNLPPTPGSVGGPGMYQSDVFIPTTGPPPPPLRRFPPRPYHVPPPLPYHHGAYSYQAQRAFHEQQMIAALMKVEEDENASYHAMNNPMGPIGYPLRAWAHQAPDFTSFSRARMQFGNEFTPAPGPCPRNLAAAAAAASSSTHEAPDKVKTEEEGPEEIDEQEKDSSRTGKNIPVEEICKRMIEHLELHRNYTSPQELTKTIEVPTKRSYDVFNVLNTLGVVEKSGYHYPQRHTYKGMKAGLTLEQLAREFQSRDSRPETKRTTLEYQLYFTAHYLSKKKSANPQEILRDLFIHLDKKKGKRPTRNTVIWRQRTLIKILVALKALAKRDDKDESTGPILTWNAR